MVAFQRGFNLGADLFKARILNATAGMEYEPEVIPNDGETSEAVLPNSGSVDSMSESTLGTVVSEDLACYSKPDARGAEGVDANGGSDFP